MKPVTQTSFGYPDGNCYAACIASILEIPLEECPVVRANVDNWEDVWTSWLKDRGLARMVLSIRETDWRPGGFYIAAGISPRVMYMESGDRVMHAVVAKDGELVHDPHPDRTFLETWTEVDLIYPLNLAGYVPCSETSV